jgi:hypothetical protein
MNLQDWRQPCPFVDGKATRASKCKLLVNRSKLVFRSHFLSIAPPIPEVGSGFNIMEMKVVAVNRWSTSIQHLGPDRLYKSR